MVMIENRRLRWVGLTCLAAVVAVPLINTVVLLPLLTAAVLENTELDAARLVMCLRNHTIDEDGLVSDLSAVKRQAEGLIQDDKLVKLKLFNATGTIVYSTDANDIGRVNDKPYFHRIVRSGQVFSKTERKNARSMEGQRLSRDVAEVYVPIMVEGTFQGAYEIYYDITAVNRALHRLFLWGTMGPLGLLLVFLGIVLRSLTHADRHMAATAEARAGLNAVLEAAPVGMMLVDRELRVRRANGTLAAMVGLDVERLIGQYLGATIRCPRCRKDPEGCQRSDQCQAGVLMEAVQLALEQGRATGLGELNPVVESDQASQRPWWAFNTVPIALQGQAYCLVTLHDITPQKLAEERVRRMNERLEQRVLSRTAELSKLRRQGTAAREAAAGEPLSLQELKSVLDQLGQCIRALADTALDEQQHHLVDTLAAEYQELRGWHRDPMD